VAWKKILNNLLRQINLLNVILLAGMAVIIIFLVAPHFLRKLIMPVAAPVTAEQAKSVTEAQPAVPPLQEYAVVSEKNLFHSKRILPPKKSEEVVQRPEFVLYGTLIFGNLKYAYLGDTKAPRSTPGRGTRQTGLKLGESMSGYTLKEVLPDRIVMVRGDDSMEVKVIAPGGKKTRGVDGGAPAASAKPATPKPATPAPAAAPRPSVAPRGKTPPAVSSPTTKTPIQRRIRNPNAERPPIQ
jgi:hypothetical protein